jgi:hypothetical protein|tara:strand:+ start:135 stop:332 length:198 start_codon:yes stop_codon:yes gene_type:complete
METGQSAELSSVATQLDDLVRRVVTLSEEDDPNLAVDRPALLEVERHLRGAIRELERFRRHPPGS